MEKSRVFVVFFTLFSLFFGAGNLILPPFLGYQAGEDWLVIGLGFLLSAVVIPVLGIWAHANLRGTLYDFAKNVSPGFSIVFSFLIYIIAISFPAPRTASVTHELVIVPLFEIPEWVTSLVFFSLVALACLSRAALLNIVGKGLTPLLLFLLVYIILGNFFKPFGTYNSNIDSLHLGSGLIEGYQTFDAIGAAVVGGVMLISLRTTFKGITEVQIRSLLIRGGVLTGLLLAIIYLGLIYAGSHWNASINNPTRVEVLRGISLEVLHYNAMLFFGALVSLACYTTAVGIITGTADFMSTYLSKYNFNYKVTVLVACLIGFLMGQLPVSAIIAIAQPVLFMAYPLTIVLIGLNILPEVVRTPLVFRGVCATVLLFTLPDFLQYFGVDSSSLVFIPLQQHHMGWVFPSIFAFLIFISIQYYGNKKRIR